MPFRLKDAPSTFQKLMRKLRRTYWPKFAIAYLVDIIIYSNTVEEHLVQLGIVLEKLEFYGLTWNPKKYYFGQRKLIYLGYVVKKKEIKRNLNTYTPSWKAFRQKIGRNYASSWASATGCVNTRHCSQKLPLTLPTS